MALQWELCAAFLYFEMALVGALLLPFIPPRAWRTVFRSRIVQLLTKFSAIYFNIFVVCLLLLLMDAIRSLWHYHAMELRQEEIGDIRVRAEINLNMKKFRAQRNFYITGFALFLWLALRRIVAMISRIALLETQNEAVTRQANSANAAAERLLSREDSKAPTSSGDSKAAEELALLARELKETQEELKHAKLDLETMKKQAERTTNQYDELLEEHAELQAKLEQHKESKKDS